MKRRYGDGGSGEKVEVDGSWVNGGLNQDTSTKVKIDLRGEQKKQSTGENKRS
jgi:hypothetical protein